MKSLHLQLFSKSTKHFAGLEEKTTDGSPLFFLEQRCFSLQDVVYTWSSRLQSALLSQADKCVVCVASFPRWTAAKVKTCCSELYAVFLFLSF